MGEDDEMTQAAKRQRLDDGQNGASTAGSSKSGGGGGRTRESSPRDGDRRSLERRKSGLAAKPPARKFVMDDDDSDDDMPLASRLPVAAKGKVVKGSHIVKGEKDIAASIKDERMADKAKALQPLVHDEFDDDDDKPLAHRVQKEVALSTADDDSDDDKPLAARLPLGLRTSERKDSLPRTEPAVVKAASLQSKPSTPSLSMKTPKIVVIPQSLGKPDSKMEVDGDDDEDDIPLAQRLASSTSLIKKVVQQKAKASSSTGTTAIAARKLLEKKKVKRLQAQRMVIKKKIITRTTTKSKKIEPASGDGVKWTTLEHNGVIFPPPYEPHGVKMLYDRKPVDLTPAQEEIATMFAVMIETDYAKKERFVKNFWDDWKPYLGKNHVIKKFELCDFTPIFQWHAREKERKKNMSAEEKKRLKEEKLAAEEKYMWAVVDGVKEKVGNFRVEPPGLFRGRGDHPKMGKLKTRILPHDIVINIGKDAPVPECPIPGQKWKEVRHDNTVTWLAYWKDPINDKEFKYVFLAASSSLKGQSDMLKYEKARTLKDYIDNIRRTYTKDFSSSDPTKQQIAVATYLIDRLALRAGNEKDEDEADTVGCCSLKVEHVSLIAPKSLQFDFLGKDSIRYFNTVEVDERVYKAIGQFKKGKKGGDDLFERLDTTKLNLHLKGIMPGLTAKVFRTYNASITLDTLLQDTRGETTIEIIADYQRANKEVAILCNHQRSVSKGHSAQMERLELKMQELEEQLEELETDLDRAKRGKPPLKDSEGKVKRNQTPEALEKKIASTTQKIDKMRLDMRVKDDLKTVALGTSKINYMDPRITVAWCKRHEVPIEKIFNKSLLSKFAWAMEVEPDFRF
ncbi:DNA topoisomerase 1 beta isoform X1 [Physcomitrium patens]|uniref:DNA topoisomerase I n=2 Tax=Physcomitrium patens TaxID=3218 RepID=A0A2K1JLY5_PHYPA|nr:DNA topoisomerase 1 beta-like [Physcomitrium patens]PNR42539.1 hypothetical protein PHYPA_017369 [Physcomitrium patens]|eukprot:XP_024392719.1 DNA topoisomerase 1 beta-like [Physcomitrella patens]